MSVGRLSTDTITFGWSLLTCVFPTNVQANYFYICATLQVAKQWPPSVVYVGECERMFIKKIPKTDKVSRLLNVFSSPWLLVLV